MLLKLTPLKKVKELCRISVAYADIETKNSKSTEFRMGKVGHFTSRGGYYSQTFWNFEDMFNFCKQFDVTYFYNVGFDSKFFRNYAFLHKLKERVVEAQKILGIIFYEVDCEGKRKKLFVLKDLFQFSGSPPTSLEKCAKSYGVEDKKFPDFSYLEGEFEQYKDEFWEYFFDHSSNEEIEHHCHLDVIMLAKFGQILRKIYWENYNVDVFHKKIYSVPSASMKVFRTNYLKESIENPFARVVLRKGGKAKIKINEDLFKFANRCYKGGYCNAYSNKLLEDIVGLDISSAYPFAMKAIRFPIGRAIYTTNIELFLEKCKKIPTIAKVKAIIPQNCGICGVREDKLVEIEGKQIEYLTSFEILKIIKMGGKILRLRGYYFEKYDKHNSYAKFASHFYKEKSYSTGGKRSCDKLNMNSLYGKTGQSIYQESTEYLFFENRDELLDYEALNNEDFEEKQFPSGYLISKKVKNISIKPFQNVIHAALITAFVRLFLIENGILVSREYCDTDSNKFERKNLKFAQNLVNEKDKLHQRLGFFEIEYEYIKFRALAPKVYAGILKNGKKIVRMKGVRNKDAIKMFDAIMEGKVTLESERYFRFLGAKESLRVKHTLNEGEIFGGLVETQKRLTPNLKLKSIGNKFEKFSES
ncbi:MAG: DNA polymerase [Atribacterota bacterium]|nr:DNA polymerase [Atribacterota bacterium]